MEAILGSQQHILGELALKQLKCVTSKYGTRRRLDGVKKIIIVFIKLFSNWNRQTRAINFAKLH